MTTKSRSSDQIASPLSYNMPSCPSCGKQGLVVMDSKHVACIHCDYKRDFSKSITKPRKKTSGGGVFVAFVILGFILFLLLSSGG